MRGDGLPVCSYRRIGISNCLYGTTTQKNSDYAPASGRIRPSQHLDHRLWTSERAPEDVTAPCAHQAFRANLQRNTETTIRIASGLPAAEFRSSSSRREDKQLGWDQSACGGEESTCTPVPPGR
jgi:hypothetical protein